MTHPQFSNRSLWASAPVALFFLALGWLLLMFLYSWGWSGGWHFDDAGNISALSGVFGAGPIDRQAALDFVFSGTAGPLGRPIALLSFLLDGSGYPYSPGALLYTNSLLHGLNALLLCGLWLAVLRQRAEAGQGSASPWPAVVACLLWLAQPLLASGVLMAVQRMALLSSTWMLLGAWLYVAGRGRLRQGQRGAWPLMLLGLGGGTVLGIFTKEQAALLPLLLWVLDARLLPPVAQSGRAQLLWRGFRSVAFYLPALAIAAYLLRIVVQADSAYAGRDFSLDQRLWTQAVALWDYVRLALLPRSVAFGPFHDDYPIYQAGWASGLALLAWVAAALAAWALRRKTPWPLFALLWFAVGHVVESSVVPLELYFEHRNYLAIAGPLFALVMQVQAWVSQRPERLALASLVAAVWAALLAFNLGQTTSLFGQPPVAAQLWVEQHPGSVRAAQYHASVASDFGDTAQALAIVDAAAQRLSPSVRAGLELQGLQLACVLEHPQVELAQRYASLLHTLPLTERRFGLNYNLDRLKILAERQACGGYLTLDTLKTIAARALTAPKLRAETVNLRYFLAQLAIDQRDLGNSMAELEAVMQEQPQLPVLVLMTEVLGSAGLHDEALALLTEYPLPAAKNPWLQRRQDEQWQILQTALKRRQAENLGESLAE